MSFKFLAYYLPQFHPIPENDLWWEKGFTEWTNVAKAKPLFKGHNQPRLPADLGFYDLRVPEIREQQAILAREAGIEGFVYYHYWFGDGKRLLELPFSQVLSSGKPDFPFMLCWANQSWQGTWFGASKGKLLIEQRYPGKEDYIRHFRELAPAFADHRYIRIDGKPVFNVYRPHDIPDLTEFSDVFREQAHKSGIGELYLLSGDLNDGKAPQSYGFDGLVSNNFHQARKNFHQYVFDQRRSLLNRAERRIRYLFMNPDPEQRTTPLRIDYSRFVELISDWPDVPYDYFPQLIPDWDNSARAGQKSLILTASSPDRWRNHVQDGLTYASRYKDDKKLIFIKSWNEWAEGNYLEPDQKWGHAYLEILKKTIEGYK